MTDRNFKAMNIPYYYAVGCRDGDYSFDIAYTSDTNIAVAMRNAFENTWKTHPDKGYRVTGFNGNGAVLEPYCKPHDGQRFWISALPSFKPMDIGKKAEAFLVCNPSSFSSSHTVAVCASSDVAKKLGSKLMMSTKRFKTMNGYLAYREDLNSLLCCIHTGEQINRWFKTGRL